MFEALHRSYGICWVVRQPPQSTLNLSNHAHFVEQVSFSSFVFRYRQPREASTLNRLLMPSLAVRGLAFGAANSCLGAEGLLWFALDVALSV